MLSLSRLFEDSMDYSLQDTLSIWDFQSKNTGELVAISFSEDSLTRGMEPGLLHCMKVTFTNLTTKTSLKVIFNKEA